MKVKKDELTRRYLMLIKLDAEALFDRVVRRKREYIEIFALKRRRDHFNEVFYSKYWMATFSDLVYCSEETISTMDKFYRQMEELKWYLDHTDDMPNTINDELDRCFKRIKESFDMLNLYLEADLGVEHDQSQKFDIAPLMPSIGVNEVDSETAPDSAYDFGEATFVSEEFHADDLENLSESGKDNA